LAEAIIKKCGVGVSSWLEREFDKPMIINKMPPLHSLHIFSERMRQALPGERDLVEICSSETIRDLLDTVLKWPLTFVERNGERGYVPIWWWRGGFQRSIIRYEYVDDYGHFLINEHELDIAKLVAHRTRAAEDMEFIYVETRAVDPSGIYTLTDSDFAEMVARFGFASEELGYYNGRYINIAELDDGYTRINGEVVPVTGEAEVRRRYLTPYNLLIAPKASRINNSSIDRRIQALLNGILTGVSTLQDIVDLLYERPRKNY
jgi:hypothetical protein